MGKEALSDNDVEIILPKGVKKLLRRQHTLWPIGVVPDICMHKVHSWATDCLMGPVDTRLVDVDGHTFPSSIENVSDENFENSATSSEVEHARIRAQSG